MGKAARTQTSEQIVRRHLLIKADSEWSLREENTEDSYTEAEDFQI